MCVGMCVLRASFTYFGQLFVIPSKNIAFIQVFFYESRNSMQYRSPNAILDQTGSIVIRLDSGHRLDTIGIQMWNLSHSGHGRLGVSLKY